MAFSDALSAPVNGTRAVLDFLVGAMTSTAAVGAAIAGSTIVGGLAGPPGAFVGVAAGLTAAGLINNQVETTIGAGYRALGVAPNETARLAGHRFGAVLGSLGGSTLGMQRAAGQ